MFFRWPFFFPASGAPLGHVGGSSFEAREYEVKTLAVGLQGPAAEKVQAIANRHPDVTTLVIGFLLNAFVPSIPLAAAFALGACGIQVGTCLLASEECPIHPNYKQAVLKAKDSDTVVTGRSIGGPVRILKNKMAREYLALEKRGASLEELEKVTLGGLRRAVLEGDVEMGSVMSGQVAGMLHEIRPVAEIFRDLYESGIARAKATAAEWSDAE